MGRKRRSKDVRPALLVVLCACATPPSAVEIAAPIARAPVAPAHEDVFLPREAALVKFPVEGAWVSSFPREKTFAVVDLPPTTRVVLLTWRIGASHPAKPITDEEEDYPANHVAPVDLVVGARHDTRTISFGELSGTTDPAALSWCARTGWKSPNEEQRTVSPSPLASFFSVGLPQGDDQMAIVRDRGTLHVIHRMTSDGRCDETKQGPLDVCEGAEWQRVAEVHVPAGAEVWELVDDLGRAFDCGMERMGQSLIRP